MNLSICESINLSLFGRAAKDGQDGAATRVGDDMGGSNAGGGAGSVGDGRGQRVGWGGRGGGLGIVTKNLLGRGKEKTFLERSTILKLNTFIGGFRRKTLFSIHTFFFCFSPSISPSQPLNASINYIVFFSIITY